MTIAQQFIAGIARTRQPSPGGTPEGSWTTKFRMDVQSCLRHSSGRHAFSQQ